MTERKTAGIKLHVPPEQSADSIFQRMSPEEVELVTRVAKEFMSTRYFSDSGEIFEFPVKRCQNCDHHWQGHETICRNCYESL